MDSHGTRGQPLKSVVHELMADVADLKCLQILFIVDCFGSQSVTVFLL